jgi:hypothetical protein
MQIPGEALVAKMWETLAEKGVGTLLKPWAIRREGRATAEVRRVELLLLAQTERDVEAIRRGEKQLDKHGNLTAIPFLGDGQQATEDNESHEQSLLVQTAQRIYLRNMADALQDEIELSKIALYAEEDLLEGQGSPTEGNVSDDWLRRWRESAEGISSDNLQQLWGRILSGEFRNPGKYSLRTLEFIRNLSQGEAHAIEELGPFVFDGFGVIYANQPINLESLGLDTRKLIELQEIGILLRAEPYPYSIWSSEEARFENVLTLGGRAIRFTAEYQAKILQFQAICLTKLGKEILALGRFEANDEYFIQVAKAIKNNQFSVSTGTFSPVADNRIALFDLTEI